MIFQRNISVLNCQCQNEQYLQKQIFKFIEGFIKKIFRNAEVSIFRAAPACRELNIQWGFFPAKAINRHFWAYLHVVNGLGGTILIFSCISVGDIVVVAAVVVGEAVTDDWLLLELATLEARVVLRWGRVFFSGGSLLRSGFSMLQHQQPILST